MDKEEGVYGVAREWIRKRGCMVWPVKGYRRGLMAYAAMNKGGGVYGDTCDTGIVLIMH